MSQRVKHWFVWLRRLRHSRGFGIQSPTDYAFVRYVVCEPWPYYAYDTLGQGDDWLTRRLGRLYFRLANWRQPATIVTNGYEDYFAAGCRRAAVTRRFEGVAELVLAARCRGHLSRPAPVGDHRRRQPCGGHLRPLLLRSGDV